MAALRKGIQNNNSLISVNAAGHQVSLPMSCKKLNFCTEFTEHCDYNFHGKKGLSVNSENGVIFSELHTSGLTLTSSN